MVAVRALLAVGDGLESRMPSFAKKLTDDEKRAIAEWVVSLK